MTGVETPTTSMVGRRRDDTDRHHLPLDWQPGDYWRVVDEHGVPLVVDHASNLTGEHWMVCTPNGLLGNLVAHTVRERPDRTIDVLPGDGSSNSILVEGGARAGTWHGYIHAGEWRSC